MITMRLFCCVKQIIFLLLLGLTLFLVSQQALAANAIGQMVWVKGSVQATEDNQPARTLQRRSPVYEHDTIVTGSGSGQIIFTDNSTVALREGTTFHIDQYKFTPTSPSDNKYVAGISKGGFRTITGLISKANPEGYQVKTPVATIGVRGTEYSVFFHGQRMDFLLIKGIVIISNPAGSVELNVAKNRVYAAVTGLNIRPVITDQPSPVFGNQPAITNSSTGTGSISNGAAGTTSSSAPPIPKGQVKAVSGFCIN